MSQITDYSLNDAPRAAVLAKINLINQALLTKNSGAGPPLATYPFMDWIDTANGLWKVRNAANTAWVTMGDYTKAYLGYLLEDDAIALAYTYVGTGLTSEAVFTFPSTTKRVLYEIEASSLGVEGDGGRTISAMLNTAFASPSGGLGKFVTPSQASGFNSALTGTRDRELCIESASDCFETLTASGEISVNPSTRCVARTKSFRIPRVSGAYAADSTDRYCWSPPQSQNLSTIRFRYSNTNTKAAANFPTTFTMKLYRAAV